MNHESIQSTRSAIHRAAHSALQLLEGDLYSVSCNANSLSESLEDVERLTPSAYYQWKQVSASWTQGEPVIIGRWASPSAAETLLTFLRELRDVLKTENLHWDFQKHPGAAPGLPTALLSAMEKHHRFTATHISAVRAALVRLDHETQPDEDPTPPDTKDDIIDAYEARKLLGTKSNTSLQRWVRAARVQSVTRGKYRKADILSIKAQRESKR